MAEKSEKINAYILNAKPFAKPILEHIRNLVHAACPQVEEKIKWGFPHFDYKGQMMCSMAGFKQHCAFVFWKASLIDPALDKMAKSESAMGHLGRITDLNKLPSDKTIMRWIKKAMQLNDAGIKISKSKPSEKKKSELIIPDDLFSALNKNKHAIKAFSKFSYSQKNEYIQWVEEAKTEATRNKRIETTVIWVSEGKIRNWKYLPK